MAITITADMVKAAVPALVFDALLFDGDRDTSLSVTPFVYFSQMFCNKTGYNNNY